jgi:hypothetical protein
MPPVPRPPRHPVVRVAQATAGVVLMIAAPLASPLPGPGGILLFAGGLVLVLRNSRWARKRFARGKRRWPRLGRIADLAMRRQSALRRRALDKAARAAAADHPAEAGPRLT